MRNYHFDLGNSSQGPVGFCAVVKAGSPDEALSILREQMPQEIEVLVPAQADDAGVGYIRVYFNPDAIACADARLESDLFGK